MASSLRKTTTKSYEVPETNLFITCYVGDIRDTNTKGVVTGEHFPYSKNASQVTNALCEILGETYKAKRLKFLEENKYVDDVFVIKTGNRDTLEYVFHASVRGFTSANPQDWLAEMRLVYRSVWKMADKEGVESLTLPILGAGNAQAPLGLAIRALVHSLFQCKTRTLKEIRIVSMYEDVHSKVLQLCDEYLKKCYTGSRSSSSKRNDNCPGIPDTQKPAFSEQYQTTYQKDFSESAKDRLSENHPEFGRESRHSSQRNQGGIISGSDVTSGTGRNSQKSPSIRKPQMALNNKMTVHNKDLAAGIGTNRSTSCSHGNSRITAATKRSTNKNSSTTKNAKSTTGHDPDSSSEQCPICMDVIKRPKELSKCGHTFCDPCISASFKHKPVCPVCNTIYGVVTGDQPDGRMAVERSRKRLPGHEDCGTIIITYSFYDGVQKSEHPNPGQDYHGTKRIAYLPDNPQGQKVCRLLRTAFDRKLTFTVGQSSTTGRDDVVTWNDIHHKTSTHGGQQRFGYPDATYLTRVQQELASKGVTEETDVEYL
ncbi:uncharacterized protein LOC121378571 isoform X2 [Gigantopelta aegis]|nr:uncharacterized protein LOC121378571 isoform X2 [Gigantopelta aegis]XP_041362742.1 uncharacterized protein LOC121378571 isoform X2 [Gigantopelta aegis]